MRNYDRPDQQLPQGRTRRYIDIPDELTVEDFQYLTSCGQVAPSTEEIQQWCGVVWVRERCPKGGAQIGQRDSSDEITTYPLHNALIVHRAQDSEDLDDEVSSPKLELAPPAPLPAKELGGSGEASTAAESPALMTPREEAPGLPPVSSVIMITRLLVQKNQQQKTKKEVATLML